MGSEMCIRDSSPGSDATGASPRTSRLPSKAPRHGCRSPASNSSHGESQDLEIHEFISSRTLTITGFAPAEIDVLIEGLAPADDPSADEIPDPEEAENIVVRRGDLFHLGRHRLLCGDATCNADFEALMSDRTAQMVITDPPYNIPIDGFQTEILQFPAGKHDDQVDSLSQFLMWITKPRRYGPRIRSLCP